MRGWLYFAYVQFVALVAMVTGWFLLIVPCVAKAWEPKLQAYQPKWAKEANIPLNEVNAWKWSWLNNVWGNDEDGVTGTPWYNPNDSKWRAYLWSAWRNSANNLRFVYRWVGGPFYRKEYRGWYFQCGWYPNGFPVLSAGRV